MRNGSGVIIFFFIMVSIIAGGFLYFSSQFKAPTEKTVTCKNDWSTISFVINEQDKTIIMNGELVSSDRIKAFNSSAISAQWRHGGSATRFYLDRISGNLEVETTKDMLEWDKNILECSASQKRF